LGSENNAKKRKFHETAVMHMENNVISRPILDISLLWHYMLMDEKKEIMKERKPRNQVDNREKPVARKRSRESDNERKEGNKVIRIEKQTYLYMKKAPKTEDTSIRYL
jgi:hypothetical protein